MITLWHRLGTVPILGMLFLVYASLSLAWSPGDRLWAAGVLATLAASFWLGSYLRDLRWIGIGFVAWTCLNIVTPIFFPDIPFGIYGNRNFLGCVVALAIAVALAQRLYWFLPLGLVGHAITQSRGAMIATGVTLLIVLWAYNRLAAITTIGFAIAATLYASPELGISFLARLGVWQSTLNHLTPFGHGFGSFYEAYNTFPVHINMTLIRPAHAYNDALELLFDLGIGTIPLWILLILCLESGPAGLRLICFTFLALGLSFFPLYIIPCGQIFALALGQLYRERTSYGSLETNRRPLYQHSRYGMGV